MTKQSARRRPRGSKAERRAAERRAKQRRTILFWVLAVVGVAAMVAIIATGGGGDSGTPADPSDVSIARAQGPPLQPGETVPEFTAPGLEGGSVRWSDYTSGPVVLTIWAPWCPHCQAELPRLSAALEANPAIRPVTVATAIGQAPGPSPEEYLASEGLSFPVAVDDSQQTLLRGLGVQQFPTTYYVRDGVVTQVTVGEVDPAQLTQILSSLQSST
jgi:peroxiredoxin